MSADSTKLPLDHPLRRVVDVLRSCAKGASDSGGVIGCSDDALNSWANEIEQSVTIQSKDDSGIDPAKWNALASWIHDFAECNEGWTVSTIRDAIESWHRRYAKPAVQANDDSERVKRIRAFIAHLYKCADAIPPEERVPFGSKDGISRPTGRENHEAIRLRLKAKDLEDLLEGRVDEIGNPIP